MITDLMNSSTNDPNQVRGGRGLLSTLFKSFEGDPKGSITRAWGLSLLLISLFIVIACWEVYRLEESGASNALKVAAAWTGITQLLLAGLGSFIIDRFSTPFAVGFLIGLVLVMAQQNLLLCISFHTIQHTTNNAHVNTIFANFAFTLSILYIFFALVLINFREHIFVTPITAKGLATSTNNCRNNNNSVLNTSNDTGSSISTSENTS
uniref:Uncharacterized protein n=1 Tax=Eucampia antarctica TaxID=49252 RepID=A0A7S2S8F1_9STRA|mmetsp:Transcript_4488/g.4260  ORF Transcript_4488/g.4260 Transcript_4488/m.4260 type:complete len:208 (+) Transcript_4488:54-677(+)